MQLDPLRAQTSVDAKTAQETLALAIRLQQEKGDRISIEELQRTADEAGIDRVYLESALHQVSQKAEPVHQPLMPDRRMLAILVAIAVVFMAALGTVPGGIHGRTHSPIIYLAVFAVFMLARRSFRASWRGFRGRHRDH